MELRTLDEMWTGTPEIRTGPVGDLGCDSSPVTMPNRPMLVGDFWDTPIEQPSPSLLTIEGCDDGDVGLFYPGRINALWAEPNRGKSLLCQHLVLQEAAQERATLTIDFEKPFAHFRSRIQMLGATREHAQYIGYWNPTRAIRDQDLAELLAFCARHRVGTVIVDAVGRATAQAGLDDSSNPEYRQWIDGTVMPLVAAGIAVVLVDHPRKEGNGPGRSDVAFYPKGAGAKLDVITGAAYTLRTREPFTKHRAGRADIICTKDTEGARAIGDHVADLIVTPTAPDSTQVRIKVPSQPRTGVPSKPRPTVYMEKVSRVLAESSEPLCISEIKRIIGGKSEWVGVAVERLLEEGHATEQPGPRKARMITQVKPFRTDSQPTTEQQTDDIDLPDTAAVY
jgi:hypothetical protein